MSDNAVYDIERDSLDAHVTLCAERYKRLEDKFAVLESRLDNLAKEVGDMKKSSDENMDELKELIQKSSDGRFKAVVAASATVVAALISALAYVITKIN
jgi:predicted  nucleic acid-binding Zn-ribbon protein